MSTTGEMTVEPVEEFLLPADWRDFVALTKPRVMSLVVFTGAAGLLAAPSLPHPLIGFVAILCIALGAGAAGAFNQWWERGLDARMKRTENRPLPAGRMQPGAAIAFSLTLSFGSVAMMGLVANWGAAALLAASILYYDVVYTIWLKPRTPLNIVIGGAAGAFPPLIGWVAATGSVAPLPLLLFALILLWTPPHSWALALFTKTDYAAARIPMMPVVAGQRATRVQAMLYAVPMAAVAVAPWPLGYAGALYGAVAAALSMVFLALTAVMMVSRETDPSRMKAERRLFGFSILYLFALFGVLVVDRLLLA